MSDRMLVSVISFIGWWIYAIPTAVVSVLRGPHLVMTTWGGIMSVGCMGIMWSNRKVRR